MKGNTKTLLIIAVMIAVFLIALNRILDGGSSSPSAGNQAAVDQDDKTGTVQQDDKTGTVQQDDEASTVQQEGISGELEVGLWHIFWDPAPKEEHLASLYVYSGF